MNIHERKLHKAHLKAILRALCQHEIICPAFFGHTSVQYGGSNSAAAAAAFLMQVPSAVKKKTEDWFSFDREPKCTQEHDKAIRC